MERHTTVDISHEEELKAAMRAEEHERIDELQTNLNGLSEIYADVAALCDDDAVIDDSLVRGFQAEIDELRRENSGPPVAPEPRKAATKAEQKFEALVFKVNQKWQHSQAVNSMTKALELLEAYTGQGSWIKQVASGHPWLHGVKPLELIRKRIARHEPEAYC